MKFATARVLELGYNLTNSVQIKFKRGKADNEKSVRYFQFYCEASKLTVKPSLGGGLHRKQTTTEKLKLPVDSFPLIKAYIKFS